MRKFLDNLIAFVGILDRDGVLIEVNKSPLQVAGVEARDVIGTPFWDCIWWSYSTEWQERLTDAFERALRGEVVRYDARIRIANDERMWIDFQLAPWFDDDGEVTRLIASGMDLTDRRRAEAGLRVAERRFRSTFENAAVGMAHVGLDGRFLDVNRRLCDIFGFSKDELLERTFKDVSHEEDVDVGLANLHRLLRGEIKVYEAQKRYRRRDGSVVWAQLTTSLQRDDLGEPEHLISIIQDISDRRKAEEELQRNQERLRTAQLAGGVGLYEWEINTGAIHWTPELESLYGLEPGSFGGSYEAWQRTVHPDDLPAAEQAVRESFETSEFVSEWRTTTPDGEERWIAARGWVQQDDQDRPIRMIGMNIDVTERRRHEEQMRTVMAELNHRVKNTLAVIQSIAQQTMRRTDTLESFAGRFLPRIHSMARAHSLLTQSEWAGANLGDILESEIEPRVAAPNRYVLEGPLVSLRPQAALTMHMIVHELATNAIKHGALAGPAGRIVVRWDLERDSAATLSVHWTESGVEPAAEGREVAGGFGSQLIRQLLEYELRGVMHSEMGPSGISHRFRFPLRPRREALTNLPVKLRVTPSSASVRVLVVEDSFALAMTLRDELEEAGFRVLGPCGDLPTARRLASESEFEFAVLDVDLGGEPVYPLARELQARGVPFLLLTGFNRQDLARDLQEAPLLNKPIEHGRLVDFIQERLGEPSLT